MLKQGRAMRGCIHPRMQYLLCIFWLEFYSTKPKQQKDVLSTFQGLSRVQNKIV